MAFPLTAFAVPNHPAKARIRPQARYHLTRPSSLIWLGCRESERTKINGYSHDRARDATAVTFDPVPTWT
jgi:hypothetical protein